MTILAGKRRPERQVPPTRVGHSPEAEAAGSTPTEPACDRPTGLACSDSHRHARPADSQPRACAPASV